MKKLFDVLVLLLAINFLAIAGGAAWLVKTAHVDKEKVKQIKEVLFAAPATQPTTQPVADSTTQPTFNLDELVAREAGKSATEQVDDIQHTFDAQMAELDRREREVKGLNQQVEIAKVQLAKDRTALEADKAALQKQKDDANKLASDQGFQDALQRYEAMQPKQAKQIFLTLDDQTVMNFFQAMEPRDAAKIMKEYKTDDEVSRLQKILERHAATAGIDQAISKDAYMRTTVNQTTGSLFSLADLPVKKSIQSSASDDIDSFETALQKATPKAQTDDSQSASSRKTSQSDSKSQTKKTSKTNKGKSAHKKSDRSVKADQDDESETETTDAAAGTADAAAQDQSDDADDLPGEKKQAIGQAADPAAKDAATDPTLQSLATANAANAQPVKKADKTTADGDAAHDAHPAVVKAAVQKKTASTTAKTTQVKAIAKDDSDDDSAVAKNSDDVDSDSDTDDAQGQVATKQTKTKTKAVGLGGDDGDAPALETTPGLKAQSHHATQQSAQQQGDDDGSSVAAAAAAAATIQNVSNDSPAPSASSDHTAASIDHLTSITASLGSGADMQGRSAAAPTATAKADAPPPPQAYQPPEVQFAETNHTHIVTGIQGQLLPNGGTMQIRLDPPELGALQVSVRMQNGAMTATFETSNDDATRVLSHSLSQLKHALESQGVSVDKLHVQQSPRDHQTSADDQQKNQSPSEQSQQKQEQQRRELLNRMWKRLTNGSDPLDMVA